jgi:hypothetical protein
MHVCGFLLFAFVVIVAHYLNGTKLLYSVLLRKPLLLKTSFEVMPNILSLLVFDENGYLGIHLVTTVRYYHAQAK